MGFRLTYGSQFEYGVSWEKPDILPIWEAQVRVLRGFGNPLTKINACSSAISSTAHR